MPFLLLHLLAGFLAGVFFRVQTLALVASLVLIEAGCASLDVGITMGVLWVLGAEVALQVGYVAGACVCSIPFRGRRLPLSQAEREQRSFSAWN
jgi:hypothetical protein